jgi:hypothetical protein
MIGIGTEQGYAASSAFWGGTVPYSINNPTRTGLYTAYEYPEVVPVVTIKRDELAGVGV